MCIINGVVHSKFVVLIFKQRCVSSDSDALRILRHCLCTNVGSHSFFE